MGEHVEPADDTMLDGYGRAEMAWHHHEPRPFPWRSGAWSIEVRGDELADIRFDGTLLLRNVRVVARDGDWQTVPARVVAIQETAGLQLDLHLHGFGADIAVRLTVVVEYGHLTIAFEGTSRTDFERARFGLVVLHPPAVAGAELVVGDSITTFPVEIAPHQPALDIRSLEWTYDGVRASARFDGDLFEMEDQRNWTDASFKTYSTPLSLPFPVLLAAGESVAQSVRVSASRISPAEAGEVGPAVLSTEGTFPSIAVSASSAPGDVPPGTLAADAVLVELELDTTEWPAALDRAVQEAGSLPLDVRLVASSESQIDGAVHAISELSVVRLAVFSASRQVTLPELWDALVASAASHGIEAELIGGARSHFTEINRAHEQLPAKLAALTFSITPQMHATERAQLVESIAMQRLVAEHAVRIADGRPVHVGPVTLRSRYNTAASSAVRPTGRVTLEQGYGSELVDGATDARQQSSALAAWTIASVASLAVDGVASISFFETWGPRGLRGFPVEEALAAVHGLSGRPRIVVSGLPQDVWAVGAVVGDEQRVLVATIGAVDVSVELDGVVVDVPAFGWVQLTL